MAAQVEWLVAIVVILVALLIVAFLWELARRIYYWTAARVYGSSTEEKFMRETASLVREAARAERRAKQNEALTQNLDRRRMGAFICAAAVGALCLPLDLPWWHTALIAGAVYVGIHMAVGIGLF